MARIISIANQKGRRGQNHHSHQSFGRFGGHGKKVLLVDCDPQANSTSGLGLQQENLHGDLYGAFYEPEKVRHCIAKTRSPFLDILPASTNLVAVELELVDKMAREFFWTNV